MSDDEIKISVLSSAATDRKRAVLEYQINIDNYRLAILDIENHHLHDEDMVAFKAHIEKLLADNIREQKKEKIMLGVILSQLGEI